MTAHTKDRFLVSLCKGWLRFFFAVAFRIRYRGLENIPAQGPALVVPNHQSYLDPMLVGAALRRPVRYMAMKKLFRWRITAEFLKFYGAFPVNTQQTDRNAIRECLRALRSGEAVIIFPEGGRSRDGLVMEFFDGFARISILEGAPVVPVTIAGAHRAWPPHRLLPVPGRIQVTFHPAIDPSEFRLEPQAGPEILSRKVREAIQSAL